MFRIIILLVAITTCNIIQAQNSWNDYIIGRPMQGYSEAKGTAAKEWGINYQAHFAGCIISDEITQKAADYDKKNQVYFKEIEAKFGKDWMRYFNLDVQKKMQIEYAKEDSSYWVETVVGKPNINYFETKEAVAKTWGISYKADFAGCDMTEELREKAEKGLLNGEEYQRRLTARFGENWQEQLETEIAFELAKKNASTDLKNQGVWKDCIVGVPNGSYVEEKQKLAKEWGINYEPMFMGCKQTKAQSKKLQKQINAINEKNKSYLKEVENHFGENWKTIFDLELQKRINKS